MARIELAPDFKHIRGRMGDIVLYNIGNREYARHYTKPLNPDTEKQKIVRKIFADAVKSWQALSVEEKYRYNKKARRLMSGYNFYISSYIKKILHGGVKGEIRSLFKSFNNADNTIAHQGASVPAMYFTPIGLFLPDRDKIISRRAG